VFILDDALKWREVIKVPSLEGFNWEGEAKKVNDALNGQLKAYREHPYKQGL
jgi:hypothetical protein